MNGLSGQEKTKRIHILQIFNVSDKKKEIPDKLASHGAGGYIKEDAKEICVWQKQLKQQKNLDSQCWHFVCLYQMKRM